MSSTPKSPPATTRFAKLGLEVLVGTDHRCDGPVRKSAAILRTARALIAAEALDLGELDVDGRYRFEFQRHQQGVHHRERQGGAAPRILDMP